ncbi:MAG: hypothetical protein ABEJ03_02535 [Candidatus Nanohaloarchaea archaeon]
MVDLDEEIESLVEKKVQEVFENEGKDSKLQRKVEKKLDEKLENKSERDTPALRRRNDKQVDRRGFLKTLGLGAGGLALASSGTAASLLSGTTVGGNNVFHEGNDYSGSGSSTSTLDADTVDGKDASELGGDGSVNSVSGTHTGNLLIDGSYDIAVSYTPGTSVKASVTPNDFYGGAGSRRAYQKNVNTSLNRVFVKAHLYSHATNNAGVQAIISTTGGGTFTTNFSFPGDTISMTSTNRVGAADGRSVSTFGIYGGRTTVTASLITETDGITKVTLT